MDLTLATKPIKPHERPEKTRPEKTRPENDRHSCEPFCLRSLGHFTNWQFVLGNKVFAKNHANWLQRQHGKRRLASNLMDDLMYENTLWDRFQNILY